MTGNRFGAKAVEQLAKAVLAKDSHNACIPLFLHLHSSYCSSICMRPPLFLHSHASPYSSMRMRPPISSMRMHPPICMHATHQPMRALCMVQVLASSAVRWLGGIPVAALRTDAQGRTLDLPQAGQEAGLLEAVVLSRLLSSAPSLEGVNSHKISQPPPVSDLLACIEGSTLLVSILSPGTLTLKPISYPNSSPHPHHHHHLSPFTPHTSPSPSPSPITHHPSSLSLHSSHFTLALTLTITITHHPSPITLTITLTLTHHPHPHPRPHPPHSSPITLTLTLTPLTPHTSPSPSPSPSPITLTHHPRPHPRSRPHPQM